MLCHSVLSAQLPWASFARSAVASEKLATVMPPAVERISGSLPTLPRRKTLLTPFAMMGAPVLCRFATLRIADRARVVRVSGLCRGGWRCGFRRCFAWPLPGDVVGHLVEKVAGAKRVLGRRLDEADDSFGVGRDEQWEVGCGELRERLRRNDEGRAATKQLGRVFGCFRFEGFLRG